MNKETDEKIDEIEVLLQRALDALKTLSKTVIDGRKPPGGAYAFFSHNAHALSTTQDCGRILRRMRAGRIRLTELANMEDKLTSASSPPQTPVPENIQEVMREAHDATELMKLDFESLYMFGGILLDQWSLLAIAVGNISCKKVHPFTELVNILENNEDHPLTPVWTKTKSDMLWLYYQIRFYRNRFIVHANRPWQRGTTRSVYGSDFNLFVPTPPGWLDDDALDADIRKLLPLTPDRIRNAKDNYWEKARPGRIIEVLFDMIPEFDKMNREKISSLFGKKGGSTPNFSVVAIRLLQFIAIATEELITIANLHMSTIDLGKPHSTGKEVFSRRKPLK